MRKTFVGYDLGDGETITDQVTIELNSNEYKAKKDFPGMTMPDQNTAGEAVPSAFAKNANGELIFASGILDMPDMCRDIVLNFKRRPSDLLPKIDEKRQEELLLLFKESNAWPPVSVCQECDTDLMDNFKESVISFTNAIFENPQFKERLRGEAIDSESIVFCVGHPTKWNDLDVAIYKAILKCSVLGKEKYAGKPAELIMAAESRAAFLYAKDKASMLPKGTCALLLDLGSSTIDLTALLADSRNHVYNSGSNYLGARGIDLIIRDWAIGKLRENRQDWEMFQELLRNNPSMDRALTLACRKAKEKVCSQTNGMTKIRLDGVRWSSKIGGNLPFSLDELRELMRNVPLAPVLKQYTNLPDEEYKIMGNKSWTELFTDFLTDQKTEMSKRNIKISRIILTGSASKMPDVVDIIQKVLKEVPSNSIVNDTDPSRTISKGLALVGPSNEKSIVVQGDLQKVVENELPNIIKQNLPELADKLSKIIARLVESKAKERMKQWRSGDIETLRKMNVKIREDCSEENLKIMLMQDKDYMDAIKKWMENSLGKDIAISLKALCEKHGVSEIKLDSLNIMKIPEINPDIKIDPIAFSEVILNVVALLAGIIAYQVIPAVIGIVVGIISIISMDFAISILAQIAALSVTNPGVLLAVLSAGVIATVVAAYKGGRQAKEAAVEKLQDINLPKLVRKALSDKKINAQFEKNDMRLKIKSALLEEEVQKDIIKDMSSNLSRQIEKRAEDIKYIIEAK